MEIVVAKHDDLRGEGGRPSPRFAVEAAQIAEARADAAAGRFVSLAAVEAWAERLGTALELPVPQSGR